MRYDIDVLKILMVEMRDREKSRDMQAAESMQQIRGDILEVNRKLDRLIERR